jgi:hypothetical protein
MLTDQVFATSFTERRVLAGIGLLRQEHVMDDNQKSVRESDKRFLPAAVTSPTPKLLA